MSLSPLGAEDWRSPCHIWRTVTLTTARSTATGSDCLPGTVPSALEETEDALVKLRAKQAWRDRLQDAVKSNQEAVRLSIETYPAGLTDFLSVIDAQHKPYASQDLSAHAARHQRLTRSPEAGHRRLNRDCTISSAQSDSQAAWIKPLCFAP
jgi:hypothetical protein